MTQRQECGRICAALAIVLAATIVSTETAESATAGPMPATGVIFAVPGLSLGDGETVTIGDGAGGVTTVEFDSDASILPGNAAVSFGGDDSAAMIAVKIRDAVNASALQVTAFSAATAVGLANDNVGSAGNVPMTETVSDGDFMVVGMSGGTDDETAPSNGAVNDGLGDDVDHQGDASGLDANWAGFTDDVGIAHYEYRASASPTCTGDVVSDTMVGTEMSHTATVVLSAGTTYFSCVRAYDPSGNVSAWVASDGVSLAEGTLTVTSAVRSKGRITVTFDATANTTWITPAGASSPFECNLGRRGAWVSCASGDGFKSSVKSVAVRGYLDVTPPVLVQSLPYASTN